MLGFGKRNASSSVLSAPVEKDHLLWSLGSLCQLFRVPFDARLILQRFPPPYTLATLCEAAQLLGFNVREDKMPTGKKFPAHGLPALALPRAGSGAPALILKTDGERVLLFNAGSEAPQTVTLADLRLQFLPVLFCLQRPEKQALRRDECVLHGSGEIALGAPFDDFTVPTVNFALKGG